MSDEAHLPAEQSRPQAPARLPRAHGDARRTQGAERAPGTRPQETQRVANLAVLKRRADFLAANGGRRAATPGFILLVRHRQDGDPTKRIGFTVTRKIGKAVVRNRMKRRFRALAREIIPLSGHEGSDHVMIGRSGGIERDFSALRQDLTRALEKTRT
jgi:ribonuclease P protein component